MSYIGCYTAHAYCDNPQCVRGYYNRYPFEVTGRNAKECRRVYKKAGWQLGEVVLCAECTAKGKQWAMECLEQTDEGTPSL
jgi:hypothetical protein